MPSLKNKEQELLYPNDQITRARIVFTNLLSDMIVPHKIYLSLQLKIKRVKPGTLLHN